MNIPLVKATGVVKGYRRGSETVHALQEVELELHPHEVVALIGPSGSGKSTLLNLLAGWEDPDSGDLSWKGTASRPPIDWAEVAIVPQKLGLVNELSVEENITLPLRFGGLPTRDSITALRSMERLGLDRFADRLPLEISVGEQQRTALARALVLGPSLLLLDEPTGHQDADWVDVIFEMLREAASAGACCLVATHNPEVLSFADRVLEIRDGLIHVADAPGVAGLEAELSDLLPPEGAGPRSEATSSEDAGGDHAAWRRPGR